ncbi:MAG: tetratricopeptide repeat protein [Succinivibrionaceae bacterium]
MLKRSHVIAGALVFAAGVVSSGTAGAETQSQIALANSCYQAFENQKYDEALKACVASSDQGDAVSSNLLGAMYENGYGVEQDFSRAFDYYKKAAEKELPEALNNLADLYQKGQGVDQNPDDARFYYAKAARMGDPNAGITMYRLLMDKSSPEYSPQEAYRYLEVAADGGYPEAQYLLALDLLAQGDSDKSEEYLEKATRGNYVPAFISLADIYLGGKDPQKAAKLYLKASNEGNAEGSLKLARMYLKGNGVKTDYAQAFHFFGQAANQGSVEGKTQMGLLLIQGQGTEKNVEEGLKLLEEAAVADVTSEAILADELYSGEKIPQNLEEAYRHYTSCALKTVVSCQRMVGKMLTEGEGIPRDPNYGISWLEKAADQNYVPAIMDLGEIYYSDKYNHQDFETSKRYFRLASELGNQEATEIMLTRDFK